jgi:hypothetical protein
MSTHTFKWVAVRGPGLEWTRSAAERDDGMVFIPAAATDKSETEVLLCASFDCPAWINF